MSVAFFDMDGTIINGDTNDLSLSHFVSLGIAAPSMLDDLKVFEDKFYKGNLDINEFIKFAVAPLIGMDADKLDALLDETVNTCIVPHIRKGAKRAVGFQKNRGYKTVIVTSTVDYIAERVAKAIGADDVIAATMEKVDGKLTGNILGKTPFQENKVERIKEYLASHNEDLKDSYAYGDSINDLQMLLMAEHKIVISPAKELRNCKEFSQFKEIYWSMSC